MKLYGSTVSPFVQRVLIAARLKGHEIAVEPVPGGSLQSEEFAAISPMRRIPVLDADGWTIAESAPIIAFLDEALDGPALLPPAAPDRARARMVAGLVDTEVAAGLRHFVIQKLFRMTDEPAVLDYGRRQLMLGLDAIERVRGPGLPWAAGDTMTLADAALFPFLILAGIIEGASDCGALCTGRPDLDAYRERMAADPLGARVQAEMEGGFAKMMAARGGPAG
jgi:glutathione S-transferase